ncbi:MAG: autotransporter assembly complex family protein [Ectothiorhodospiraceae bacterium]|nr:autotransporter assembly complex family protein [Ectothiorhodospiraceae bacterium]
MNPSARHRYLATAFLLATTASAAEPIPRIDVTGIDGARADNVRAHLSIQREPCDLSDWRVKALQRRAVQETTQALRALGHYQPEITTRFSRTDDCWSLAVDVQPGPPVRITRIHVELLGEAADDPAFIALRDAPGIAIGSRLDHGRYETLRDQFVTLAADRGYFEARYVSRALRVDPETLMAEIELVLDAGPRYRFGETTIEQDILRPAFVARFLPFAPGDPYSTDDLLRLQRVLEDNGYFERVEVRAQRERTDADRSVPIRVTATPRARRAWSMGIGAATDVGPRLRLGFEDRRVNRNGHRFNADLEAAPVRSRLTANYLIPLGDPVRERLSLQTELRHEETDAADTDLYRIGAIHQREHTEGWRSGWIETRSLSWLREHYTVAGSRDRSSLLMPSWGISRSVADHPVLPQRGWRVGMTLRGAASAVASDTDFGQALFNTKLLYPFGQGRLIARAEGGTTVTGEVDDFPASLRFFAGGDTSVRGYAYQSLAPRDADGELIGGRHLLTASLEYDRPVYGRWDAAVFIDAGNAFDRVEEGLKTGVGFGVRWRSPIGPVRLDLAWPLDEDDRSPRLHFTMGPDL